MQQRHHMDGDTFEDAPRVDPDIIFFYMDKKDAFPKVSGCGWTRPKTIKLFMLTFYFLTHL